MTYRSASPYWASYCKLLGCSGVVAACLTVAAANGQEERSSRSSDKSSAQDESARQRDDSSQDESSRSSRSQTDQRRRSDSQSSDRSQQRSAQNRSQPGTQYGERSQYSSQSGQTSRNQYNQNQYNQDQYSQQNRSGQSRSSQGQQGRFDQTDRSATYERRGQESDQQASVQSDAAWLGVYLSQNQNAENGAQITQVYPAGPAARAGLRAGDIITAVDGQRVSSAEELISAIEENEPGARAQLSLTRNNQQMELPLTLGSRQSFAWHRPGEEWGGQQGGHGGYASSGRSGNEDFRSGQSGEDDYWSNVPPFAMQLEHERRMYEQHQRIETQIAQLQQEIRQLREELRQRR